MDSLYMVQCFLDLICTVELHLLSSQIWILSVVAILIPASRHAGAVLSGAAFYGMKFVDVSSMPMIDSARGVLQVLLVLPRAFSRLAMQSVTPSLDRQRANSGSC